MRRTGALSLRDLLRVVIDGSWSGPKRRTLFEQGEAAVPTVQLLARKELKAKYESEETRIFVF